MKTHRWWLALVAALLSPWIGPHVEQYLPVGWVLLQAGREGVDGGFWALAALLLVVAYALWLGLFSLLAAWPRRRKR